MLRAGAFATALSRAKLSWEPIARAWPVWCMGFQSSCGAGSQPAPLLCAWHSPAPVFTHQNNPSPDSDLPPPRQFPALVLLLSGITRGGWGSIRHSMPADHTWTCQMLLSSLEESQAASLISHNRLALAQMHGSSMHGHLHIWFLQLPHVYANTWSEVPPVFMYQDLPAVL